MADEKEFEYEAGKRFVMGGVDYEAGDPVDTSKLSAEKISQFLNQRLLRPARKANASQ